MSFEIIDFHTHPFIEAQNNICNHQDVCDMCAEKTKEEMLSYGISKICGSVIRVGQPEDGNWWNKIKKNNDIALALKEMYGDFYVPGFHVHPDFVEESIEEMYRMHEKGVHLIGEIVPYLDGWDKYANENFYRILDVAEKLGMVVSFHGTTDHDDMDALVKSHPNITFVGAHPGEYGALMRHIARLKENKNYYLDLSGTGLFRYGMLRKLIDAAGADRILFGSDFPTCNTPMFLGGVLLDQRITDAEKQLILADNAKRILKL